MQQQIPCGNDRQKSKGSDNSKGNSRSFATLRMTNLWGNDRQKSKNKKSKNKKSKNKGKSVSSRGPAKLVDEFYDAPSREFFRNLRSVAFQNLPFLRFPKNLA